MGKVEFAACGAVAIVALALIALIWILTQHAVQEQQVEIRERAEHALSAQAGTIAETIGHELLMIDQSLMVLQAAWKTDSNSVDLNRWQATMPALTAVTDDLFISDELRVIRQDILPKAVGQGVGSAYVTFPHGSLEQFQSDGTKNRDSLILQGDAGEPIDARHFLMYIIRPLDHPAGWLIGASYRSEELTKLFAEAALGYNSFIALTDTKRGVVQSIVGPAARRPKVDISKSALFAGLSRTPSGLWLGDTPIDGTQRMHAFQRVSNRDMSVMVAANWSEVMAVADNLAAGAYTQATVGSGLVLLISGIVLWEVYTIRANKRQKRVFDRTRSEMERLRGEEGVLTARAQLNAARLNMVMDITSDGIALFGSNLRLAQWNHLFHRGIGIEPKHDMQLDSLLRAQAGAGLFGQVANIEAEVSRRVAVLQSGDTAGVSQPGPDGETLILRGLPITDGGFMLLLNGLETWAPAPQPAAAPEIDEPAAPETVIAAPIEW
jgi:PAS domain-containing protein